ncbi:MAG: prepilin peptidase [Lachnospiraceae bacterium]|nr:prepilin peptidase [Lachnospiraceae bacterium]
MAAFPLARTFVLALFLIPVSVCDLRFRRIPNRLLLAAVCAYPVLLAAEGAFSPETILRSCVDCLLAGVILGMFCFLCRVFLPRSVGAGDVKLLVLAGLYLGLERGLAAALLAVISAAAAAAVRRCQPGTGREERIPLAPFLAAGAALSLLCHF